MRKCSQVSQCVEIFRTAVCVSYVFHLHVWRHRAGEEMGNSAMAVAKAAALGGFVKVR